MLLDHETQMLRRLHGGVTAGFGGLGKITLGAILDEFPGCFGHGDS
jgi:hypothetical protein